MAGPYYVTSFSRASQIVLARNPNYRGHRPARPGRIDITVGAPPATSIARVIAGTEDYYAAPALSPDAMSPAEETRLRARYGAARRVTGQRFFASPWTIVQHLAFNTARAVRDPRLRRAVGFALDRNALVAQRRADGPSLPTDQYLPPGLPGFRDGRRTRSAATSSAHGGWPVVTAGTSP
jgi:ABC-type oligopeptide transport system substrate-binding subunit